MVIANAKDACCTALRAEEQGRGSFLSERRYGERGTPDVSSDAVGKVLHPLLVIEHHSSDGENTSRPGWFMPNLASKQNFATCTIVVSVRLHRFQFEHF